GGAALPDLDTGAFVGEDVAALDGPLALFVHQHAGLLPIADLAIADRRIAAPPDQDPGALGGEDVAVLHRPLAPPGHEPAAALPRVNLAVADRGVAGAAVDGHAGQGVRGNIAVLQQELPRWKVHRIKLLALTPGDTAQGQPTNDRALCVHENAGRCG